MQDNFHYKTDSIDGHSPTKGNEAWKLWFDVGTVATDGTQASLTTNNGKEGDEGHVKISYPFDLAGDTLYTLKVTFQFKPKHTENGGWAGFGFGSGEDCNSEKEPWMFVDTQRESTDDTFCHALVGQNELGGVVMHADDYARPITAKITRNTSTGETQYYINDEAQVDWTQKLPASIGRYAIFVEAMNCGTAVKVTNITLTAEPVKKQLTKPAPAGGH